MTATPTRRQLLSATALLPIAACTHSEAPAKVDPDDAIRAAAVERELALVALYDGALATAAPHPTPAVLAAVRAEHAEHLAALGHPPPSPGGPVTAGALAAAERAAAAAHAAAALDASPALAAVLASLAASEASHPVALA